MIFETILNAPANRQGRLKSENSDLCPGSWRLTAPPRPVESAAAEEEEQYEYYQDGFHIITTSLSWTGKQIVP